MSSFKGGTFNDRRDAAAKARQEMLEKFRAQPAPDDPAMLAKAAERLAIAEAREVRAAERRVAKEAELAEKALQEAARKAEAEALKAEEAAAAERAVADAARLEVERKAARDARYAARKARR
jgi:hypothetical protein